MDSIRLSVQGLFEGLGSARRRIGLLLFVLCSSHLAAQETSGKLEGHIRDGDGRPVAEAQVFILGTAYHSLSDPRGYYFLNSVPAGPVTIRAAFIGYRPLEIRDLRVIAGQTVTQDFVLMASPLELQEISVVAAENVLVPRDEVATRQRLEGEYVEKLPVDRLVNVLALEPGIAAFPSGGFRRGGEDSLSIRGGRPEENIVYVDGVPVTGVEVATRAVEQASITTGASSAEFGNYQSGVISVQTRSGGTRFGGTVAYETDEPFGVDHSLGFNRIEASLGGPLANHLGFFVSGVLTGAQSAEAGKDANRYPVFVPAGVDTTVTVLSTPGSLTSDTTRVDITRFAVYRGDCSVFQHSANPGIRSNYGLPCQGIRFPANAQSTYQLQGKLSYSYGTGSRLALSMLRSQTQGRPHDYHDLYNAQNLSGDRTWNTVLTLNWTQNLSRSADRALALDIYLSYQMDRDIHSPLDPARESGSRDPLGGFLLGPLPLRWDFDNFPVNEELVRNILVNAPGTRRSPLNLENTDQYLQVDQYRNSAYGLLGWPESGGPAGTLLLHRENRGIAKANLDWQVDRYNRLKAGGELTRYSIGHYENQMTAPLWSFFNVYIEHPVRWNAFLEDRLDLGDLVLVGGLRYDWYDSRASRPTAARTYTMPGFDPAHPTALFRRDRSHHYLSPHIQVSFPVTTRTNIRFSYAHQVQAPDWNFIFAGINGDLGNTTLNFLGSDLDFGRTILYEFGVRHAFSEDMVLDLAAYNKDNLANVSARALLVPDPTTGLDRQIQYFTNADYGNTRGVDLRLDRRIGTLFNGTVGYSFQDAKSTGSDPLANYDRAVSSVGQTTGGILAPPQGIIPTTNSRPHTVAGQLALTFPDRWHAGTRAGAVLQNLGIFAVFRMATGTAYTPCGTAPGNENAFSGLACVQFAGPVNSARLPAYKQFDLRITKGFRIRGMDLTVYLDARNLFNFTNIHTVFSATNTVTNPADRQLRWASDSAAYADEARASGVRLADGSLDLSFGGMVASGCGTWVTADLRPAAPNCVYLIRAEERYGNGDHLFTLAEQRRADDAFYTAVGLASSFFGRGLNDFVGPGRRLRVGIEVTF
jgi:hypothetical protein